QRPARLKVDSRTVFHLDKSHCGIFHFICSRIPWSEQVALCRLLKPAQLIEYRACNTVDIIIVHAPQCNIQRMGSDIDQRTSALLCFVHEYAPGRNASSADRVRFSIIDITQFSRLTCCMEVLYLRTETVLISNRKLHAGFLPCIYHLQRLDRA